MTSRKYPNIRHDRKEGTRNIRDRFLIICEGEKTEPNYFRKFPVNIDLIEMEIEGLGQNTLSLVQEAIRRREKAIGSGKPYNQIWCVFDRDSFPAGHFNQAFHAAKANRIRIAYSNQCFELWYFLHFYFNDAAIARNKYSLKLSKLIGKKYMKNDTGMYDILKNRQQDAIKNAKKLMSSYRQCNPEADDPSTTVYLLVETLNNFISDD